MLIPIVIHKDRTSDYGVTAPALPGCFMASASIDEALVYARDAIELHLEGMLEDGEPLPEISPVETLQHRREYRGGTGADCGNCARSSQESQHHKSGRKS